MKSDIEIKDILYQIIKGSSLELAITGELYKNQRPTDSDKEDIVISVLDGLVGQIQSSVINVNIYVRDVARGDDMIENEPRVRELSRLAISTLEDVSGGEYRFSIEKQQCLKVEGIQEYCINNKINLQITNF